MRSIGRAANFIAGAVITMIEFVLKLIGGIIGVCLLIYGFTEMWSLIDPTHLDSAKSLAGIAGTIFLSLLTLNMIGNWLDPFDAFSVKPKGGGGEMRSATRDDLRSGGLFGRQ
jgi:hypothetical protein